MKSIVDVVRRWPSRKAKAWVEAFIPQACSHPSVLAVVVFGAAVRTTRFTADLDLLVIYDHEKPNFEGRPIDVDIRWYERNKAESFIREGQELLGWVVRYGELLCERDGYWTRIREEWVDRMPFPSAEVAEQRVERAWRLYRELSEMGDEDAAQEQRLVALTQEARAKLIRQRVYPASRPELPAQLRAINEVELVEKLEAALRDREQASAISQPAYSGRGEVVREEQGTFKINETEQSAAELCRSASGGGGNMNARFAGGPLDGQSFDHHQINAVATIVPVFTESGNRSFLLTPPLVECERILRGEMRKEQAQGPLHPYERVFLPGGGVEFRDASGGAFEAAVQSRSEPLSPEAQARKQAFGQLADQFIAQLRAATITGATEVSIIYRCVNQQGNPVSPIRESITPRTSVRFPGDPAGAQRFAAGAHLDTLIGNVNSLVRNAPTGFVSFPAHPGVAVQIQGFELEIEQP